MSVIEEIYAGLGAEHQRNDEVLWPILQALEPTLEAADNAQDLLAAFFDPDLMPDQALDWGIWANGWPIVGSSGSIRFTDYAKRQVLKKIPQWRKNWGQVGVFEDIIATYTKTSSVGTGITITLAPRVPTGGGIRIGRGRIGRGRIWEYFSNMDVLVKITALGNWVASVDFDQPEHDFIYGLLDLFLPPWQAFELREAF